MGKVIYYGDIFNKLYNQTTQLSKKKYKRYCKLLQWVDNGEKLLNEHKTSGVEVRDV